MAQERRLAESLAVTERATTITSVEQFKKQLETAGDQLVVLEFQSDSVCQMTWDEPEPELHWKLDVEKKRKEALAKCNAIKHTFQRVARECTDVVFLSVEADTVGDQVLASFGVDTFPTVQFWRRKTKLWEHRGAQGMEQDLGEGVLYYGDTAAGGSKATDYVKELFDRREFESFVARTGQEDDKLLKVVMFSTEVCAPCVHIYPATLAIARSFVGQARFARLIGDSGPPELIGLMAEMNVVEVPAFMFYRAGQYVGRHVGSSRGDLIGKILEMQASAGIAPPPPPPKGGAAAAGPVKRRKWGSQDLINN